MNILHLKFIANYSKRLYLTCFSIFMSFIVAMAHAEEDTKEAPIDEVTISKKTNWKDFRVVESGIDGYYGILFNGNKGIYFLKQDFSLRGYGSWWTTRDKTNGNRWNNEVIKDEDLIYKTAINDVLKSAKRGYILGPFGSGKLKVYVRTAPDCPACVLMHKDFNKLLKDNDVSIYVIPTLLRGDADSYRNAIMCSENPIETFLSSMNSRKKIYAEPCEKSYGVNGIAGLFFGGLDSNGGRLGLGTPSIILENGYQVVGWSDQGPANFANIVKISNSDKYRNQWVGIIK